MGSTGAPVFKILRNANAPIGVVTSRQPFHRASPGWRGAGGGGALAAGASASCAGGASVHHVMDGRWLALMLGMRRLLWAGAVCVNPLPHRPPGGVMT